MEETRIVCVEFMDNGGHDHHIEWVNMAFLKASQDPVCQRAYTIFDAILNSGWKGYPGVRSGSMVGQDCEDWFHNRVDNKPLVSLPCFITDHIHVYYE